MVVELTLTDLAREVAALIQRGEVRQGNGQVSPFPDRRTLRYYTTIGLLDRPLAMRGRQAVYGERHIHQAVAVKRMQAAGLSLGEIQTRLAGLPTPELAQVAEADIPVLRHQGWPAHPRSRWWTAPPAEPVAAGTVAAGTVAAGTAAAGTAAAGMAASGPGVLGVPVDTGAAAEPVAFGQVRFRSAARRSAYADALPPAAAAPPAVDAAPPAVDGGAVTLTAVRLGGATTLLVPADRPLSGADLDAIRRAAAPLVAYLTAAGLTGPRPDPKDRS
jgi:DNA-binding transcriptional MerR regulator